MKFSITLDRARNGAWTVECPALPGGIGHGRTRSEALRKARESVALCLAALEQIPARTTRKPKHTFSSENLIGSFATGLPTGDNATIRRLARQRLREKNR